MIIGIYGGIVFFLIIGFIVLLYSWKRQRIDLPQILPFLVWQFLVIIPFLAQASNMERIAALWQAIGIEIINVGLIVYLGLPKKKISFHKIQTNCVWHKMWRILNSGYFYTILFFLIVTYHIISLNGNIPLINSLMGVGDSVTMREEAVKLLDVPFFMKYIFRWTTNIIAPIAIILYWNKKQYAMCFLQFVLAIVYTKIKDANGPLFTFLAVIVIYFIVKYYSCLNKKRLIIIVMTFCILAIRPIWFFALNEYSGFRYEYTELTDEPMARQMQFIEYPEKFPSDYRKYNYFLRRVVLLPAAVSHEWYSYVEYHDEYFGYADLLPSSKSKDAEQVVLASPSNRVGLWAAEGKWIVGNTISSNCSMDADSYARGGWFAVIITSLLFSGLLYLLNAVRNEESIVREALYISAIGIITMVIMSASLHAILIAQGILPILIGMIIIAIIEQNNKVEDA